MTELKKFDFIYTLTFSDFDDDCSNVAKFNLEKWICLNNVFNKNVYVPDEWIKMNEYNSRSQKYSTYKNYSFYQKCLAYRNTFNLQKAYNILRLENKSTYKTAFDIWKIFNKWKHSNYKKLKTIKTMKTIKYSTYEKHSTSENHSRSSSQISSCKKFSISIMSHKRSCSPDYFLTNKMVLGQPRFHVINNWSDHHKNLFWKLL